MVEPSVLVCHWITLPPMKLSTAPSATALGSTSGIYAMTKYTSITWYQIVTSITIRITTSASNNNYLSPSTCTIKNIHCFIQSVKISPSFPHHFFQVFLVSFPRSFLNSRNWWPRCWKWAPWPTCWAFSTCWSPVWRSWTCWSACWWRWSRSRPKWTRRRQPWRSRANSLLYLFFYVPVEVLGFFWTDVFDLFFFFFPQMKPSERKPSFVASLSQKPGGERQDWGESCGGRSHIISFVSMFFFIFLKL